LVDLDAFMRANSGRGTQMTMMRLGHFVGAGNELGMVSALVSRLRTRLVPWLAHGRVPGSRSLATVTSGKPSPSRPQRTDWATTSRSTSAAQRLQRYAR
jgi:hypothetical protein